MSYISVEADERLEEGPEGLQFKTFLPSNQATTEQNETTHHSGVGNADRGYLQDQPHRKTASGFWTVEYYQSYFDVDTATVLKRCYLTMLPRPNYISTHLNPPDLYGPFWTQTTLIFSLFLSSSLAASIAWYMSADGKEYDYNFQLLSLATSLVYSYGIGLPALLWIALRYIGVGEWSLVEAIAIWGYSLFIWIPVSILCVIPVPLVRLILVVLAFGLSGYFLVINIYPILASAEAKATRLIIILIAVLHAGLALSFYLLFFNFYATKIGPDVGPPDSTPNLPSNTTATLLSAAL